MSPPASTDPNAPVPQGSGDGQGDLQGQRAFVRYLLTVFAVGALLAIGYWLHRRERSVLRGSGTEPIGWTKLSRETEMTQRKQQQSAPRPDASASDASARAEPAPNLEDEPMQGVKHAPSNVPAHDVDAEGKTIGYEVNDANTKGVAIAAVALVMFIALGLFAVGALVDRFDATRPRPTPVTLVEPSDTPEPPSLWIAPVQDMADFQTAEQNTLTSYGWVDQANGVARIPITQAMQLLIAQPLPARDQAPPELFQALPAYQMESSGGKEVE